MNRPNTRPSPGNPKARFSTAFLKLAQDIFKESTRTSLVVIRIIIPISIITRILNLLGLTEYLAVTLRPLMEIVGLPGSMGLVLATSIITNLYAGMAVFFSLVPTEGLSVAQVTVLTTMMLVAHALPVEIRIAQKAGPRLRVILVLRLGGALLLGWILNQIYTIGDFLQSPAQIIWEKSAVEQSWKHWLFTEIQTILLIFVIITLLICLMKAMNFLKITAILSRLVGPPLRLLGMSEAAAPVTIIGMTMGIGYGGGLIINEARSGRLPARDVFFSLAFMSLMHSVIEDTLLMIVMGGHVSGVLWGRLAFSVIVIFTLVRVVNRVPESVFNRFFFRRHDH